LKDLVPVLTQKMCLVVKDLVLAARLLIEVVALEDLHSVILRSPRVAASQRNEQAAIEIV
jgi:hypothetical protein